jgi:eukaryotic-like serine/threonine-protein kinase
MTANLLQQLAAATSDAERNALLLAMSLAGLSPDLQTAVYAAAIPHWFDALFLEALLGAESDLLYEKLLDLSFVELVPQRGYALQERTRRQLLARLWQADPDRFRDLSGRATDYCAVQAAATGQTAWQAEEIYHRLVSDPAAGVAGLRELATKWANYEHHTYDEIEQVLGLAQEQIEAGRLAGAGAAWTRLWQAKLALIYGRPDLAGDPLNQVELAPDGDPLLAAELAQTRGDWLARRGDHTAMAAAYESAYHHYHRLPGDSGRLDAYLVAEKLRQAGLPPPDAETPPERIPTKLPGRDALRLIANVEAAWIEGVLKPALAHTIDLRLARDGGQPANLLFHRPQGVDRPLVAGQRLGHLFTAAGGSLLILGAPGSGKTITLLQLLAELLEAARTDGQAAIPLLFNLSSFAAYAQDRDEGQAGLVDWLAEQAYNQYRLKRTTTREELANGRFTLLLDGLDEVALAQREQCVAAINHFMQTAPCGLVVCSRISDYQVLQNRLALAHAVVLQPLGNRQIEAFLGVVSSEQDAVGVDYEGMQRRLVNDWQLREALRSPLLLNLYPQAFPNLSTVAGPDETVEARRQALFAAYVETVFDQPLPAGHELKDSPAGKEESKSRLTFLAGRMQQMGQSLFFVEELQPTWLPQKLIGRYRALCGLLVGLPIGLLVGLLGVLLDDLLGGLLSGLFVVLSSGIAGTAAVWLTTRLRPAWLRVGLGGGGYWLLFALLVGLIIRQQEGVYDGWLTEQERLFFGQFGWMSVGLGIAASISLASFMLTIQLRERVRPVRPNRQRITRYVGRGILYGLLAGVIVGLIMGLLAMLIDRQFFSAPFEVLFLFVAVPTGCGFPGGLLGGLIGAGLAFWDTPHVDERPYPGSGIRASLRNALIMITLAAIFFGLPTWFIDQRLQADRFLFILVLVNILPPTFTWFGGLAWVQHWSLRFILARRGWLPWRLVPWLEQMAARGLLRRVGGGYIFVHRSLLEYFAALAPSE